MKVCIERARLVSIKKRKRQALPIYFRRYSLPRETGGYLCMKDRTKCGTVKMITCVTADLLRAVIMGGGR